MKNKWLFTLYVELNVLIKEIKCQILIHLWDQESWATATRGEETLGEDKLKGG